MTQFFPPESGAGALRVGALATALREHFRLRVVTLEPGYPDPALYAHGAARRHDQGLDFRVERRRAFRPHDTSLARRALREIGMSALLAWAARRGRPRVVVE